MTAGVPVVEPQTGEDLRGVRGEADLLLWSGSLGPLGRPEENTPVETDEDHRGKTKIRDQHFLCHCFLSVQ